MNYPASHIQAVKHRLREYKEVIQSGEFKRLRKCVICKTVREDCLRCLLDKRGESCFGCKNILYPTGYSCKTLDEIKERYTALVEHVNSKGLEYESILND